MTENIKPEHCHTGEIDLYELWYQTYPFEQYKAIMQAVAEQNMRLDDNNRVENLEEAIYILERLKEKEIEQDRYSHVKTNYGELLEKGNIATEWTPVPEDVLGQADSQALEEGLDNSKLFISDIDISELLRNQKDDNIRLLNSFLDSGYNYLARDEDGELWVHNAFPHKHTSGWSSHNFIHKIEYDQFSEVKWTDDEPTKIAELLASYENGGEN